MNPNFTDYFKNEKLSFNDFYQRLKVNNPLIELRIKITKKLDMPDVTFWYKLRKNKFDDLEKKEIAKIFDRPVDELFPKQNTI